MDFVKLHLGDRDTSWEKYGISSAPVYLKGSDGVIRQSKNYKAILRNDTLASIVSSRYQVLPNEKALELLQEAGFQPQTVKHSRDGNAMYATWLGGEDHEITRGDRVKVGVIFRNSIDGSTSFGGDVFSYRWACKNGAVARDKDIASISRKHTGSFNLMIEDILEKVQSLLLAGEETIQIYRGWTRIRMNQQLAEDLVKQTYIAKKYIPGFINIEKGKVSLTDNGKNKTVWETFNSLTEAVWHSPKLDMRSKTFYTEEAHKILAQARI